MRWAQLVTATVEGNTEWDFALRKPLGNLSALRNAEVNYSSLDADYFDKAANYPDDYIGTRILDDASHREASYNVAAKYLPPIRDYVVIGDTHAPVKAVVTMTGQIKRSDGAVETDASDHQLRGRQAVNLRPPGEQLGIACMTSAECTVPPRDRSYCYKGECVTGGGIVFDGASYSGLSEGNCLEQQAGVIGGYLRVASVGCFNQLSGNGFEMMAIGPMAFDNDTILVAIHQHSTESAHRPWSYLSLSLDRRPCNGESIETGYCANRSCCSITAGEFFAAVLEHAVQWSRTFAPALKLTLPYAERRQIDMAKGALVATETVYIGDQPNYGTSTYWRGSPPAHSMMDTSGVPDSLPLTTLSLNTALLEWGLFDSALRKVGFYLDTFIFQNGTVDMGHWKDVWPDEGDGIYNCSYPDSLADMGRVAQLFADTVRFTRNTKWMAEHIEPVLRIGKWLLRTRAEAVARFPVDDPRYGLIYGPAEHDTCDVGMNGESVVDGQQMLFYFSVSMWSWRGMVELGSVLQDHPQVGGAEAVQLATALRAEAPLFKRDIDAALAASVVRNSSGDVTFVPVAVTATASRPTPYSSMTSDTLSSYSNFRYYSEMLSSGAMDQVTAGILMDFRENHGGCLSGMTRFTDHLDDMPAAGYANSALAADRIEQYLLLLYGHTANYQGRGSFLSNEQQSLYQDPANLAWRASLGDIQASFCTPSQTLVASMTAMQVVATDRDRPIIWLARAAPRRWYVAAPGAVAFAARRAPSRWGTVSFSVTPVSDRNLSMKLEVDFAPAKGGRVRVPTVMLRLRSPDGLAPIANATARTSDDCVVVAVHSDDELVELRPTADATTATYIRNCTVSAHW